MSWLRDWIGLSANAPASRSVRPMAASGDYTLITSPEQLEAALRHGNQSGSGQPVTERTTMGVPAAHASVRLIAGAVANMPVGVKRRVDDKTREDATDHALWTLFHRRPNRWQKPAQFKRMMQAHVLLRGNAFAVKTRGALGNVIALTPMHPDRVTVRQREDMSLEFLYQRKDGGKVLFQQDEVLHLCGLSLDGVTGVSVLTYARETLGLAMSLERHGSAVFKNGANVSGALKMPSGRSLDEEQASRLKAEFDEFRAGGSRDGKVIILEDGLEYQQMALNAEDAQWIEARKFSRGDIAMFFGVPPHMIGDTDKATSWGTGIEAQGQAFVTYTLEDHLTMWEEALNVDCLDERRDRDIYVRFNRNALVRGDLKTRWDAHVRGMQWGVYSPDEVRAMEDENPRPDGGGGVYYDPPNTAGGTGEANVNP